MTLTTTKRSANQEDGRSPWFDLVALRHPLWWAALGVLLVNDDLLKGRGVAPGWLTGKLSDLAFLMVAPPLLAALLPRVLPLRRVVAMLSIVGVYVAADLSPAFSDWVVSQAGRLGMTWRLWPDVTDLMALAVLPLTVRIMRARSSGGPAGAGRHSSRELAGVVLGAAACLATSAPPRYGHAPFFVNRTSGEVEVRVTWVLRKVDCNLTPEALAAELNSGDLDDGRPMLLASGDVAALDGVPPAGKSPVGQCGLANNSGWQTCIAAIVEAPQTAPVLMMSLARWDVSADGAFFTCSSPPPPISACQPKLNPRADPGPDALSLLDDGGQRKFVVFGPPQADPKNDHFVPPPENPAMIRIAPIDLAVVAARAATANGCRPTRDAYRALVAQMTCAVDGDCRAARAAPIPGEVVVCDVYVNRGAVSSVEEVATSWSNSCVATTGWCGPAQPAVCRAGTCTAACPGESVPLCPESCRATGASASDLCTGYVTCLDDSGRWCSCIEGKVSCKPIEPISATCPLGCLPTTDPRDAGENAADARVDGGDADLDARDAGIDGGDTSEIGTVGADGGNVNANAG